MIHENLIQENNPNDLKDVEIDILALAREGMANRNIANRLDLSKDSVHHYFSSILKKLQAKNRTHAVVIAISKGIISLYGESQ